MSSEAPAVQHVGGVSSPNFLRYWTGQTLAEFGARLAAVALPVLAVQLLHATNAQLGYLNAAQTAAFLLVGLPAGAWVDRWFKRRTMIWADVCRFVVSFAVPLLWFTHHLAVWHLYLVAAATGVASVFFDVAYQSFIPVLVPDADIGRANSRLETTSQVATFGGPALGGLLLKVISAPVLMLADAIGYLASFLFLSVTKDDEAGYRAAHPKDADEHASLVTEIREGLAFVLQNRALRRIVACTAIANGTSTIASTLFPALALRQVGLSPFLLGVVMTASSVGGVLGATLTPKLQDKVNAATVMMIGTSLAAVAAIMTPVAASLHMKWPAFALLIVSEALMAVGVLVYNITQVSMRQRLCPKHLLGRMNASIRFIVWGVMPISSLVGGFLGSRLGLMPTVWIGTVGSALSVLPLLGIRPYLPAQASTGTETGEPVTGPDEYGESTGA